MTPPVAPHKPRKQIAVIGQQLAGSCSAVLQEHLSRLRKLSDHGNRLLHLDQLLAAHLMGFYDSTVRSLRTLDARSVSAGSMKQALDEQRLARSTISDAMAELPAEHLLPLLKELLLRVPKNCSHPDLADLVLLQRRICAIDGSYFRVPADVLWALAHRRCNGVVGRQVRLDLHLDVLRFVPMAAQVDGKERGSESAAFIGTLEAGVVYLADRNFVDFEFLKAVLDIGSDFVVRLKSSTVTKAIDAEAVLSPAEKQAGVLSDRRVVLPGGRATPGLTERTLREVVVFDPVRQQEVRLLTTLLDVPAELIGKLYRQRWAIELFFRWLKCVARIKHLYSHSANGITMQFYVMIIATLLLYLRTGSRPSVYCMVLMSSAAAGDLLIEKVPEVLERLARERELERLRRLKKKQA